MSEVYVPEQTADFKVVEAFIRKMLGIRQVFRLNKEQGQLIVAGGSTPDHSFMLIPVDVEGMLSEVPVGPGYWTFTSLRFGLMTPAGTLYCAEGLVGFIVKGWTTKEVADALGLSTEAQNTGPAVA